MSPMLKDKFIYLLSFECLNLNAELPWGVYIKLIHIELSNNHTGNKAQKIEISRT